MMEWGGKRQKLNRLYFWFCMEQWRWQVYTILCDASWAPMGIEWNVVVNARESCISWALTYLTDLLFCLVRLSNVTCILHLSHAPHRIAAKTYVHLQVRTWNCHFKNRNFDKVSTLTCAASHNRWIRRKNLFKIDSFWIYKNNWRFNFLLQFTATK